MFLGLQAINLLSSQILYSCLTDKNSVCEMQCFCSENSTVVPTQSSRNSVTNKLSSVININ
jgi:hypothetical protein